jgi:hypothetical protein
MSVILEAMENASIEAANETKETWWPYEYERIENGLIVKGSAFRIAKRGKRKGLPIPLKENQKRVVVSTELINKHIEILENL